LAAGAEVNVGATGICIVGSVCPYGRKQYGAKQRKGRTGSRKANAGAASRLIASVHDRCRHAAL
jgi:hypothetical protein